jgi:transposase
MSYRQEHRILARWSLSVPNEAHFEMSQAGFDGGLDSRILSLRRRRSVVMARPRKCPPELLDRGARVVIESGHTVAHVARDLGVPAETLRRYLRQVEADEGLRPDLPSSHEREEIKARRNEVYELCRANEILKARVVVI